MRKQESIPESALEELSNNRGEDDEQFCIDFICADQPEPDEPAEP